MEIKDFDCSRNFIEKIPAKLDKLFMIQAYCERNFNLLNLVEVYYNRMDSNAILLFLILCLVFFVTSNFISVISLKALSKSTKNFIKRLGVSSTIAAATLVAIINSSSILYSDLSVDSWRSSNTINVVLFVGVFIFMTSFVVPTISFFFSEDIQLPKLVVMKDLAFYTLALLIIVIFGIIGSINYLFVGLLFGLFIIYLGVTVFVNFMEEKENEKIKKIIKQEEDLENEMKQQYQSKMKQSGVQELPKNADQEEYNSIMEEFEKEDNASENKEILKQVLKEVFLTSSSLANNILVSPLMFMAVVFVPYPDNPLRKTFMRYISYIAAVSLFLFNLGIPNLSFLIIIAIGTFFSLIILLCHAIHFRTGLVSSVEEIVALLGTTGIINVGIYVLNDVLSFLAFYFSLNIAAKYAVIVAVNTSLMQLFQSVYLVKDGESKLGTISCYSTPIFFIYLILGYSSAKNIKRGYQDFNIFFEPNDPKFAVMDPFGFNTRFLILCMVGLAFLIIGVKMIFYMRSNFVLKKNLAYVLMFTYLGFSISGLIIGMMTLA
jgi:Ca2+/Na+ antiporter